MIHLLLKGKDVRLNKLIVTSPTLHLARMITKFVNQILLERYVSDSIWSINVLIEVQFSLHLHQTVLLIVSGTNTILVYKFLKKISLSLRKLGCTLAPVVLFKRYFFFE